MKKFFLLILTYTIGLLVPFSMLAQNLSVQTIVPYQNERYLLIGINIFLLLIIKVLGKAVMVSAQVKRERIRKERNPNEGIIPVTLLLLMLSVFSITGFSQEAENTIIAEPHWITYVPADVIVLMVIAVVQFAIIIYLAKIQMNLIYDKKAVATATVKKESKWKKWFIKLNDTVPVEKEQDLDLNHDYDGIRELDNKIPRWWLYAFYGTIAFAFVYMYRMFVSETMPDQITELQESYRIADIQMKEYLKNAANNVDENTVVMLDDAGIQAGMRLYIAKGCNACHGEVGEGNSVGPNLTDEYWLHKGSINDIFYSIKYGWPDKGMKSWQAEMSPVEIAQVASYIRSLQGSNPPNAKEPQGELYVEENKNKDVEPDTPSDSTQVTESIVMLF